MPDYTGKTLYLVTNQQHHDWCRDVVNDERRWVALKRDNNYNNTQLNNILATRLPGLGRAFNPWNHEAYERYYANHSIDAFLNKPCPHGTVYGGIRETWNDKMDETMELYSHFANNRMNNAVVRESRCQGKCIPKHFKAVKNGAAAMIIWKQVVGWHGYNSHNQQLADFRNRDPVVYYNFVIPAVMYIVANMQNDESDLSVQEILTSNVSGWEESLKKKYKKYGWFSQAEVRRLCLLPPTHEDHVTAVTGAKMCSGVEYNFLRILVLLIKDMDRMPSGQVIRPNSVKHTATPEEVASIGMPLAHPAVESRYSRYGMNA